MDIVDRATRSRMMSNIRSADTRPELIIRHDLFRRGFRYCLHARNLPGRPDLSLPKYRALIYIHGCFWHGHNCDLFKWPKTRSDFWEQKIRSNQQRDKRNIQLAIESGWRACVVWECSTKRVKEAIRVIQLVDGIDRWLRSDSYFAEFSAADSVSRYRVSEVSDAAEIAAESVMRYGAGLA